MEESVEVRAVVPEPGPAARPAGLEEQLARATAAMQAEAATLPVQPDPTGRPIGIPIDTHSQYQEIARGVMDLSTPMLEDVPEVDQEERRRTQEKVDAAAHEILLEEADRRRAVRREFEQAARQHRPVRPIAANRHSTIADETIIYGKDGDRLGTPGWVYRWVRLVDARERLSNARAGYFRSHGWSPIVDPATGEPVVSQFGMAMEAPPEAEGRRKGEAMRAVVPVENMEDQLEEALETTNSRSGKRIGRVIRGDEFAPAPNR